MRNSSIEVFVTGVLPEGHTDRKADLAKVQQYLSKVPEVAECRTATAEHAYGIYNYYGIKYFITCIGKYRIINANITRNGGAPRRETIKTDLNSNEIHNEEVLFHRLFHTTTSEFLYWEYPYSLSFLGAPTFFDPLKGHLNTIATLFEDYCKYEQDPLTFPIEIDTALINPNFNCKSDVIELSTDKQEPDSVDSLTHVYDAESLKDFGYNRKERTFVWRNTDGNWIPAAEPTDTWEAVVIAKRDKIIRQLFNAKAEEIRFYLNDLKSVLHMLWSEIAGTRETSRWKYFLKVISKRRVRKATLRLGENAILNVQWSHTRAIDDNGRSLGRMVKIEGNVREDGKGLGTTLYVYKDSICGSEGMKLPVESVHTCFIMGYMESPDHAAYIEQYWEFEDIRQLLTSYGGSIKRRLDKEKDQREVVQVDFVYKQKFAVRTTFAVEEGAYLLQKPSIMRKMLSAAADNQRIVVAQPESDTQTWVLGTSGRKSTHRWLTDVFAVRLEPYAKKMSTAWSIELGGQDWTINIMKTPALKKVKV